MIATSACVSLKPTAEFNIGHRICSFFKWSYWWTPGYYCSKCEEIPLPLLGKILTQRGSNHTADLCLLLVWAGYISHHLLIWQPVSDNTDIDKGWLLWGEPPQAYYVPLRVKGLPSSAQDTTGNGSMKGIKRLQRSHACFKMKALVQIWQLQCYTLTIWAKSCLLSWTNSHDNVETPHNNYLSPKPRKTKFNINCWT